jgi:hypothetical protein
VVGKEHVRVQGPANAPAVTLGLARAVPLDGATGLDVARIEAALKAAAQMHVRLFAAIEQLVNFLGALCHGLLHKDGKTVPRRLPDQISVGAGWGGDDAPMKRAIRTVPASLLVAEILHSLRKRFIDGDVAVERSEVLRALKIRVNDPAQVYLRMAVQQPRPDLPHASRPDEKHPS